MRDVTVTRSERAVRTLAEADPEFVELCELLYGPAVNPDAVWRDAFAKSASSTLEQQRRQRTEARIAQAGNVLGLTAGAAALGTAANNPEFADAKWAQRTRAATTRATAKVPAGVKRKVAVAGQKVGPKRLAYGALGLQAANVGGDIVGAKVLARSAKKEPAEKAYRFGGRGQTQLAQGRLKQMRRLARHGATAQPAATGTGAPAAVGTTGGAPGGGGVAKTDEVTFSGTFSKLDDDKRLAFGWASVTEVNGQPVVDRQGDYIATDDIEDAAYTYVQKSRVGGDMHKRADDGAPHKVGELVESVVFTKEKIAKMGLPPDFPKGWWVGFKVSDDATWAEVKKGGRTGFSIHGKGIRRDTDYDSLMTGGR